MISLRKAKAGGSADRIGLLQCCVKLSVFFLTGSVTGCAACLKSDSLSLWSQFLRNVFLSAVSGQAPRQDCLELLIRTFLSPIAALILSYATFGGPLAAVLMAARGFTISYCVCCLCSSFGLTGLRFCVLRILPVQLICVPCLMALCCCASRTSGALLCVGSGRLPEQFPVYNGAFYRTVIVCFLLLTLSFCIEIFLVPVMAASLF